MLTLHLDTANVMIEEKRDVRFALYELQLAVVGIVLGRHGVSFLRGAELFLQVAQPRILACVDASAKMHAHFRAVVAAQHGTILYQSHLQTQSCGSHGSTHSSHSATHNNEVEHTSRAHTLACFQHLVAVSS